MAVNLQLIANPPNTTMKSLTFVAYFSGTYTLNGTGDNIDFTAAANPDGSSRNPKGLPGAFPGRVPLLISDNSGDMGGAYVGIAQGALLTNFKLRFYKATGTELNTAEAYPAGAPLTAAASNLQITVSGLQGGF